MILALVGIPAKSVVIGIVIGLTYALLGAGLVLVYRATRVINFAHGQTGALCAAVLAKLVLDLHWNFFLALVTVVVLGGLTGAAIELSVVRRLFDAPRLQLFVATLGIAQVLLVVEYLLPDVKGGLGGAVFPSPLRWSWDVGGVRLASPELMVLIVAPITVIGVGLFLTRTWSGLAIRASSDNADMSELSGISTRRVSTIVWMLAGSLAALTSVLLNPVQGTVVNAPSAALGPGLLMPALAAALVGGLTSLPLTLLGGVVIGILQALVVVNFPTAPGVVNLLLFAAVLVLVLVRRVPDQKQSSGQWSLATRVPPVPESLRGVWWVANLGKIVAAAAAFFALVLPLLVPDAGRIFLFSSVVIVALVGLSVTVLTGWAGQLSLGQYAFAGLGAVVASALVERGFSFPVAVAYAMVAGAGAALLVGFPALRVSGLFLAVTTLAFAVAAQGWLFRLHVFNNGNTSFYHLPRSELFGLVDISGQRAYYYLCLLVLVLAASATSRLRRSGIGRGFVAMRDNEPCAASFGLSPAVAKLSGFAFAGALAALAGALYAGLNVFFSIDASNGLTPFGPEQSLQVVAMGVIGGLGSVSGVVIGAMYVVGLPALFNHNALVGLSTSGIGLLLLLLYVPGGLSSLAYRARSAIFGLAERHHPSAPVTSGPAVRKAVPRRPSAPIAADLETIPAEFALQAEGISVRFGGLAALSDVSVNARSGEVVGLIGSNGAGKSTLMNVVSGFEPSVAGTVTIWGQNVSSLVPHERARLGVGRIFQDARLFGDLSVRETVKVALDVHDRSEFVPSLLGFPPARRAERQHSAAAAELIDFLGLGWYADTFISDLSTGTRRIVELCCLLARGSKLLLLDEPTAGVAQRETEAFGPVIQRIRTELKATVVIIEHDMPLVMSISDRVYCLDAGRCLAEGDPAAVRRDPLVIAAYLGTDERAIARSGALATNGTRRPSKRASADKTTSGRSKASDVR
jgi:ABC-type branched-subunit amino acid transport system ATPase component/ABC-type branched-subunit amino acid transport system permease subunit